MNYNIRCYGCGKVLIEISEPARINQVERKIYCENCKKNKDVFNNER